MKTVLVELLLFFLICIFGTAFCGGLFMCYDTCSNFIVGQPFGVFSPDAFINGIFFFYPIFLLFVPMFLMLSLIRHSSNNKIAGMITISVLTLAAWIFTVPLSLKASPDAPVQEKSMPPLSSGYFRNINGNSFYFTQTVGNFVDGIKIDPRVFSGSPVSGGAGGTSVTILNDRPLNFKRDEFGFADPLVGNLLSLPKELSFSGNIFFTMHKNAKSASQAGLLSWIRFSSLVLALLSVGAVLSASSWRLADALYVIFNTCIIICLNYLFMNSYFDGLLNHIADRGGFFIKIRDNFQIIMNCLIILLLSTAGTVKFLIHASRKRSAS